MAGTKFYLHRGTTTNTGTLPSATQMSAALTTTSATGAGTNRVMDTTIGASTQTSLVAATAAQATNITWFGRWCSAPLAAQTLTSSQVFIGKAGWQQSNTNSAMSAWLRVALFIWRPDTGAIRSTPHDINNTFVNLAANTSEQAVTSTAGDTITASGTWTVVDGDFLVIEVFGDGDQTMNTSYNRTFWYDGTVEGSATDNAAYIEFATDTLVFQGAAARVPYSTPYPPLLAQ